MKTRKILGITMIALAFLIVAGAQAKTKNSRSMSVPYDGSLAGSHIASGRYDVQWVAHDPAATVTFQKDDKVVAKAEGKVVERGSKYDNNQVIYADKSDGGRVIQELRFAGSSQVIVFNE